MRNIVLLLSILLIPLPAFAGTAEARDLAKAYNCKVTAIAPITTETGTGDSTTYKVNCDTTGISDEEARKANGTLFVSCAGALCTLKKKGEL